MLLKEHSDELKKKKKDFKSKFALNCPEQNLLDLPGDVPDTGASPNPPAGAGEVGVGAGPVPLTEGCRPRDPGLAMAEGGTPGERPGPARGAEVCTFT